MSTTNTKAETWSKDDPKVDGVYWWRADLADFEPDIHSVVNGRFYEIGEMLSREVEGFGGEWLGPISSSDTAALVALRREAQALADAVEFALTTPGMIRGRDRLSNACGSTLAALKEEK